MTPRISADSLITTIWGKRDRAELVALVEARDADIAAEAIKPLMAELTAYRDAAVYDAMMDGPRFKTWNRSQLDRARDITEAAIRARQKPNQVFDLIAHLRRQMAFSERTFGPGPRTAGNCDHIRKELREIEAAPGDITEWVDVILLALDGAWRSGATPEQIAKAIDAKQTKNEGRVWPDWRTASQDRAIEHVRQEPQPCSAATPGLR